MTGGGGQLGDLGRGRDERYVERAERVREREMVCMRLEAAQKKEEAGSHTNNACASCLPTRERLGISLWHAWSACWTVRARCGVEGNGRALCARSGGDDSDDDDDDGDGGEMGG